MVLSAYLNKGPIFSNDQPKCSCVDDKPHSYAACSKAHRSLTVCASAHAFNCSKVGMIELWIDPCFSRYLTQEYISSRLAFNIYNSSRKMAEVVGTGVA